MCETPGEINDGAAVAVGEVSRAERERAKVHVDRTGDCAPSEDFQIDAKVFHGICMRCERGRSQDESGEDERADGLRHWLLSFALLDFGGVFSIKSNLNSKLVALKQPNLSGGSD